jgi:hypothetical protein
MEIIGDPIVYKEPQIISRSGIFTDSLAVELSTEIPGAGIHYTLDGSEPSVLSPFYNKKLVLYPENDLRVRAACYRDGKALTGIAEKTFTRVHAFPATKKNVKKGIRFAYYEGLWEQLPEFSELVPKTTGLAHAVDESRKSRLMDYAIAFSGLVKIPAEGVYIFYLESDDGSRLILDEKFMIDNDGLHAMEEKFIEVALEKGYHQLEVEFFQRGGGDGLILSWQGPGMEKQVVGEEYLYH